MEERFRNLDYQNWKPVRTLGSDSYGTVYEIARDDGFGMVDHAALLIAAFDGTPGGTRYTVEYAMRRRIPIVDLDILPRSRMERKLAENRRV